MKTLRLYGAGLLAALLPTLVACYISGGGGRERDLYLTAVTYGNGLFVAVGDRNAILTSPDGVTWTQRASGTVGFLRGVTYGNGTFAAVGERSTILTSP